MNLLKNKFVSFVVSLKLKNGDCTKELIFDEGSKEAYEKGFELWPDSKRYYKFDKKKNTYHYIEDIEDSGME